MNFQTIKCQVCGRGELESLLDLGYQPLCNQFMPVEEANQPQTFYPLGLYLCSECSLVQLGYVIPTSETFGDQYTYLTGSSRSLVEFYTDLAQQLKDKFNLRPGDTVVEIGSNDGTFLNALQNHGLEVLGVEGAQKSADVAIASEISTIPQFFGKGIAKEIRARLPADTEISLIFAMNVLAHTDNINEFLPEVAEVMGPSTVFISSCHWLAELVRNFEFDTIYHEHLKYYTMDSLMRVLERHGLHVFDAELTTFYGGSIMSYARKNPGGKSVSLASILEQESNINVVQSLRNMKDVLIKNRSRLLALLAEIKTSGKRTIGIGAPMKASTLLNFYGVTPDLVEYLAEVNPLKVGTMVPGVGIPVVDEKIVFQEQPDYAMLLSWNMAEHIVPMYRSQGYKGKFILPVPVPKVME